MPDQRPACGPGATDPRALRQRLRVIAVDGSHVRLQADRMAGCAHCAARAGCGTGALTEMAAAGPIDISLPRSATVAPGDEAIVAMSGGAFLRAAGLLYLLPPAIVVLAAATLAALGLPDLTVALLCLPALALSLLPARLVERRGRVGSALRIEDVIAQTTRNGA
ncbi:positive regulator of sigma(E), RseC/MucC [Rhodovulum sp. ES.010]|uniref:SoxR reducing system RseC family protein n=1 Tax=Rhodovulum sp. ES.010 TaxID=1882821 RepID=UPI00092995BE|nr:SoxR reducing system RseC family protein [Rhodovulum sp. ES.010]SIO53752.1 positive regulator of sigma(E), RseC/MucC [Rhodovulum sp. ES.010]